MFRAPGVLVLFVRLRGGVPSAEQRRPVVARILPVLAGTTGRLAADEDRVADRRGSVREIGVAASGWTRGIPAVAVEERFGIGTTVVVVVVVVPVVAVVRDADPELGDRCVGETPDGDVIVVLSPPDRVLLVAFFVKDAVLVAVKDAVVGGPR